MSDLPRKRERSCAIARPAPTGWNLLTAIVYLLAALLIVVGLPTM